MYNTDVHLMRQSPALVVGYVNAAHLGSGFSTNYDYREIMLFIGKPKGRSMMISNNYDYTLIRTSKPSSLGSQWHVDPAGVATTVRDSCTRQNVV